MRHYPLVAFVAALVAAHGARASCGAAFCTTNTSWDVHGPWSGAGTRLDIRTEYIEQDQPRRGRRDVEVGEVPRHHDEVSTVNRNVIVGLDHSFDANWGITLTIPIVDRDHQHFHHHDGQIVNESWDFRELGDVRAIARYQMLGSGPVAATGVLLGAKLPTGRFELTNASGDEAERTLQPGSGTTDLLVGMFTHDVLPLPDSSYFAQAMVQVPMDDRDDYRPGARLSVDLGYGYQATDWAVLLLQVNVQHQRGDTGGEAEPADTGGTIVSLSPGLSLAVSDKTRIYGFVQVPVFEYVSGVQLSTDWSAVVGASVHF